MLDKFWILLLFPLFGAAFNGILGKKLPARLIGIIGSLTVLSSFGVAAWAMTGPADASNVVPAAAMAARPFLFLKSFIVFLSCANANRLLYVEYENLAVADLAGGG